MRSPESSPSMVTIVLNRSSALLTRNMGVTSHDAPMHAVSQTGLEPGSSRLQALFGSGDYEELPTALLRLLRISSKPRQGKSWAAGTGRVPDRKSTRLNSSHLGISYA